MEVLLYIFIGIGLSAAVGFRVFVPFLIMSIASLSGHLSLSYSFEWIGSYPALIAFSLATLIEISGYYIPFVDNLLDSFASPLAIIAGSIVMASFVSDLSPFLKWSLIIIAGGGGAGIIQGSTVMTRAISSGTTGGLGNPVVSTAETGSSIILSVLAIFIPVIALIIVIMIIFLSIKKILKKLSKVKAIKR